MNLYEEMAARLHAPKSRIIPRLMKMLADETDMRILLALPADVPTLSESLGVPADDVEQRLHDLYLKGVVFFSRKTTPPTYRTVKEVLHLHDTSVQWKEAPPEFLELWQEWAETEFIDMSKELHSVLKDHKPLTRIIAADVWLEPRTEVMPYDSIEEIVRNAKSLAVMPCTCRIKAKKCDHTLEACIVLNRSADYNIERGTGRKIDVEEALALFRACEEEGLVHLTGANSQEDPGPLLCNCCPCCCIGMALIKEGFSMYDPSRFRADIDGDRCKCCGYCHERCYFGAIGWTDGQEVVALVDAERCFGCGLCRSTCPAGAIELVEARGKDFVPASGASIYG